jgi:hypothetical protein
VENKHCAGLDHHGCYDGTGQSCRPTIVRLDRFPYTSTYYTDIHTDTPFPATRPVQQQDRAIHSHASSSTRSPPHAWCLIAANLFRLCLPSYHHHQLRLDFEAALKAKATSPSPSPSPSPSTIINPPSHRPSGILLQQNDPDRGGCNVCWAQSRGCTVHPLWPLTIES